MKQKGAKRFFQIKTIDRYQHYRDERRPLWSKFWLSSFDDYDFCQLDDSQKFHYVALTALCLRHNNRVPFDSRWVTHQIGATNPVDLDGFLAAGWIQIIYEENDEISEKSNVYEFVTGSYQDGT